MISEYRKLAQKTLDDLFKQNLIPFQLTAHAVRDEGVKEVRICFYDSRLHSVLINTAKTASFKDQIVAAVLQRTKGYGTRQPVRLPALSASFF
jgi:hypothetical protein